MRFAGVARGEAQTQPAVLSGTSRRRALGFGERFCRGQNVMNTHSCWLVLAMQPLLAAALAAQTRAPKDANNPEEQLPPSITRVTHFGERADWSHDGKKILFLEKTYGDVFEVEVATKIIRPVTHHYHHFGYTRALYLENGDILLSGPEAFDPKNPHI